MSRAQFKIENTQDAGFASTWIKNQFRGLDFPCEDTRKSIDAENEYKKLSWRDFEGVNTWCEKHLKKADWKKLKGAIRAKRLRTKRVQGKKEMIIRIDIKHRSYYMLKGLAKHHGVTLSEVIEIYMKDAWMELPEEED